MKYNPKYFQLRKSQLQRMLTIIDKQENSAQDGVVFFGDSITEMYDVDRYFSEVKNVYNCGIHGATAQELLWIVDEAVIKYQPKLVILMIGTNDLGRTIMSSPNEIAYYVREVIDLITRNAPNTKILLLSALPCDESLNSYHQVPSIRSNDILEMIYASYIDIIHNPQVVMKEIFSAFVAENKQTLTEYYEDGLHLNEKGYERLTSLIKPEIEKILAE